MSSDLAFRCPVCRAEQTLRETCRRCRADLSLVAQAHRRVAWLLLERDQAQVRQDFARAQLLTQELQRLAPKIDFSGPG